MSSPINKELLDQFKDKMKITSTSEDSNLQRMLSSAYAWIKSRCGDFDLDKNETGKELVMERARYEYNEALEYFSENYLTEINSFAFDMLPDEEDEDETV